MPTGPAVPPRSALHPSSTTFSGAEVRAPFGWSWAKRALGLALVASVGASGCLSDRYRIPDEELRRQVSLRPEQRGQNLKVLQQIGSRQAPAVPYGAPPPAYASGPPGAYETRSQSHVGVFVGMDLTPGPTYYGAPPPRSGPSGSGFRGGGGGAAYTGGPSAVGANTAATGAGASSGLSRAAPAGAAAAPGGAPPAPSPAPGAGTGGFRSGAPGSGSSGSPSKGNSSNDAAALAVLAVVIAATAVVGAAATEGARYDGSVNVTPYQNVYLRGAGGTQRVQALGDLTPTDLIGVTEAHVSDAEGYGLQRLGRHPLNRKGFAFKLDLGSLSTRVDDAELSGAGANIQFGYFFNKKIGILATTALTGGEASGARGYVRSVFGGELQAFLPGLGPLHFGGFGNVGVAAIEVDDAGSRSGTLLGAGALAELELTTRLALMFRVGWAWSDLAGGAGRTSWNSEGLGITGGIAIY